MKRKQRETAGSSPVSGAGNTRLLQEIHLMGSERQRKTEARLAKKAVRAIRGKARMAFMVKNAFVLDVDSQQMEETVIETFSERRYSVDGALTLNFSEGDVELHAQCAIIRSQYGLLPETRYFVSFFYVNGADRRTRVRSLRDLEDVLSEKPDQR